jgi:serine/threonine protein kinase/tetratricopeptide (TPR) repeat protein
MIGEIVSHYKIISRLGSGGMGEIYKAEDINLKRIVALKFLPPSFTFDKVAKQRFIHEAQSASKLDHPNICTIHEIGETEKGQMFISMACYEGETLKEKIQKGPVGIDESTEILFQICTGLEKAHKVGIVHRDIKPANIFITDDGIVKILDFGLAKTRGQSQLTRLGTTLGTVDYMSPEQVSGSAVDQRTDIWSLGVIMYEMITGRRPFNGDYEQAVLYSILNDNQQPVTGVRSNVPMEIERIINKLLAKVPDERYQHVDEIAADLKRFRRELSSGSRDVKSSAPPTRKFIKKKPVIILAVGIILVAAFFLIRPFLFEDINVTNPLPIAVIAFNNQTGDPSYNYLCEAIPNLLITSLEQSKYLRVMTWERMRDVMKQMGKEDVGFADKETGFELCRHEGVDAIVIGSFVKAGETFATDVKVLDVGTKDLLKSASARGNGVQSILNTQIDELSKEIAMGVGLSQKRIETQQIKEVTTSSMEAYNYFLRGRDEFERFYYKEALSLLEKAVALDSNFAIAYLYISRICTQFLDHPGEIKAIEKAKELSLRAPEKERLAIESLYVISVEKNPQKRLTLLEELVDRYPGEKRFHNDLGVVYQFANRNEEAKKEFIEAIKLDPNFASPTNGLSYIYAAQGLYDKAIETQKRYAALSPGDANPFDSMGEIYFLMGNIRESIASYLEALRVQPSFFISDAGLAYVYAFDQNYGESIERLNDFLSAATTAGMKVWGRSWKSILLTFAGRSKEALKEYDLIAELINGQNDNDMMAQYHWVKAFNALTSKNFIASGKEFEVFQKYYDEDNPERPLLNKTLHNLLLAYNFLQMGKLDSAQSHYKEMRSDIDYVESMKNTLVMVSGILESELLLAEGKPDGSIGVYREARALKVKLGYDLEVRLYNFPPLRDVVPRAFLQKGEPDSAISEYEKLTVIEPGSDDRRMINPVLHYKLAKLCEQRGKIEEAENEYKKFLEIWKDADKDQPLLIDAVKRLTNLQRK